MSAVINLFCTVGERKHYADGHVVFRAGEPGDVRYVVLASEVDIMRERHVVARLSAGQPLGETALIDAAPRITIATMHGPCTLAVIDHTRCVSMVQAAPRCALTIMQILAERLRQAQPATAL